MAGELPSADEAFGSSATLPSADEAFGAEENHPVKSGPAEDAWYSAPVNSVSRILNAVGQGAEAGWGDTPHVLSPEAEQWLQKAGTFNDYKNGRTSIVKSANEALMRPAAAALDAILHPIATAEMGMGAAAGALEGTGTELQTGAKAIQQFENKHPVLFPRGGGTSVAATALGGTGEILGAVPGGFGLEFPIRPFTPADFAKAKNLRVTGAGEAGYFGTKEPTAAEGLQAAIKQIREEESEAAPGAGEPVSPEQKARAAGGTPPEPAAPDIHTVARQIAPDTFKTYDALEAEREAYRRQIAAMSETRTETPEAQAAQGRIDDILGKVHGVEDRLTNAAAARLDAAREELDAALHRDTAEMQQVRQSLLATDYKMRDLAPQVAQAYREAQVRFPQTAEAPPVQRQAEPEQAPQQQPVPVAAGATPEIAPPNVAGAETLGTTKPPMVDIASDVAQKLVAAGRPQDEANAASAIVAAHYEARAARFEGKKGSAGDLYRRDAPEIRGAGIRKRALEMAQRRTLHQGEFKTEPGATDAQGNPLPQTIIPGTEGGAKQLAAAREAQGKGPKFTRKGQKDAGGLFEAETPGDEQGTLFQGRRGSITLGEARNTIKLFKDSDASTFMHETGHQWLEELMADDRDPEAPADLKADAQTVRDWLGAKEGTDISRAQHERFARGFERYLMEGHAPSHALADVFAKFRDWLTKIYQTVARLKVPINDDIRGVFDRLIAAKPEGTVIAPERPVEAHLADIHEAEAEHTPPERAASVADHIRSEVNSVAKEKVPDVHAGLPANEAGGIESPDAPFPGGADEARPSAGPEGNAESSRTEPARRDEAPRKSVGRDEYESALEAIRHWKSRIPAARSLFDTIREAGGIKTRDERGDKTPEGAEIENLLNGYKSPKFQKRLINNEAGLTPDRLRERLQEEHWFGRSESRFGPAAREVGEYPGDNLQELYDLIDREAGGERVHHPEDEIALEHEHRRAFEEELDRAGIASADSNGYAAHKLAIWRATEGAKQFAAEQEAKAYEELSRLEPADREELTSHGYEPGSDDGAEFEAGEEHRGDYGGLTEREAGEPRIAAPGAGAAQSGRGPAGGEIPAGPNERFTEPESQLVDKAGNIRLDNLNTPDDVNAVLRQVADDNDQFLSARRGTVSDADVLAYADAMGVVAREVNLEKLRAVSLEDGVPLAARIRVGREMLIQSAKAVHDAMQGTDELAYASAAQRHLMIQETISAVTAEVGRGLRAFRDMGEEASKAQNLSEFLQQNTGRTLFQLQDEMKKGRRLDTPAKISGFLRDARKPSLGDMALEVFKNWLISGPITHMTYSIGNTALALWKAIPETAAEAAIGAIRGTQGPERVRFGEVGAQLYAMIRGQRNGLQAAWDAMKAGQTMALPGEKGTMPLFPGSTASTPFTNTKAVPNFKVGPVPVPLGSVIRAPGERMVAPIHSYFRSIGDAQSIARQSYRIAADEGLRGDAFSRRVAELTVHPTEDMMRVARDEATEQTLMGRGGELTKRVSQLMNWEPVAPVIGRVKPFAFIDPFVHIASNIVEQSIIERSPLALFSHELREDILGHNGEAAQNSAIARAATGTALGMAGAGLAAEGLLTPSEPSDAKEAAMWRRVHGMPHSFTLGDVSIDLSRLGVLGFLLGISADIQHAAAVAPNEDIYKTASLLVHSFTQNFLDEGFMRGPSDLIKALDDNERYGASYARNFVSTVAVPFSVGMAQVAKQIDPYAREARTTMDAIKAKVPWWSETLFPRRDIWGELVPNREWLGTYTQAISHDPVDNELMAVGYYPSKVQRKIRGVELSDQQYDDYARVAGHTAKAQLNTLVAMPGFSALPVGVRQEMIKEAITSSRESARSLMMMQYPDIMQKASEAKAAALH